MKTRIECTVCGHEFIVIDTEQQDWQKTLVIKVAPHDCVVGMSSFQKKNNSQNRQQIAKIQQFGYKQYGGV